MTEDAASSEPRRLCVYNGGLLMRRHMRRILSLKGWNVTTGVPGADDWVGIWGRTPTAWRGEAVAGWAEAPVLTVEDAFLRSVHPARLSGEQPLGLSLDRTGVHFDAEETSDLETLLCTHELGDTQLLSRAKRAIEQLRYWHISKYSAFDPTLEAPPPGYVVVIDQTRGDAALQGAGPPEFAEMLTAAADEHPGAPILIKTGAIPKKSPRGSRDILRRTNQPLDAFRRRGRGLYAFLDARVRGDLRRPQAAGFRAAVLCGLGPDGG